MGVESAGDARDERAEREGQQFRSRQVDAHRFGGDIVFVDRDHGAAKSDVPDAPNDQERYAGRDNDLPQLGERANAAHAGCTSGRLEVGEEYANDLTEAEREDHHVDAADAKRRRPDDEPSEGRGTATRAKSKTERHVRLGQQRADIGADRHEAALTERNQSGRHRNVEADAHEAVDAHEDRDRFPVAAQHRQRSSLMPVWNRPLGRTIRIRIIRPKVKASR